MNSKFLPVLSFLTLLGCSGSHNKSSDEQLKKLLNVKYAKGFEIEEYDNVRIVKVLNPWQGSNNISYRYRLACDAPTKTLDKNEVFIRVPIRRVVCLSTTHIAFIDFLDRSSSILGVSGAGLIYSKRVTERVEKGFVKDVGYDQNLNYELITSLQPDVIFCYGVGSESIGYLNRLSELGHKLFFIGDYLEEHPLGKAEWIRVFGALFGLDVQADSLFNLIERDYLETTHLLKEKVHKPVVFLNSPWKDSWFFPGKENYIVKLINDAGGSYVFDSLLEGTRSYPVSLERALEAGMKSDIWLNPGTANSITDITLFDERLTILLPYRTGMIYNNNNRMSSGGGNDFWESGVVRPDLVLKDLIFIFNPAILPDHQLYYYKKLE